MMPLYAARIQDLETDDFLVFDGDIILAKLKRVAKEKLELNKAPKTP